MITFSFWLNKTESFSSRSRKSFLNSQEISTINIHSMWAMFRYKNGIKQPAKTVKLLSWESNQSKNIFNFLIRAYLSTSVQFFSSHFLKLIFHFYIIFLFSFSEITYCERYFINLELIRLQQTEIEIRKMIRILLMWINSLLWLVCEWTFEGSCISLIPLWGFWQIVLVGNTTSGKRWSDIYRHFP